MVKEFEKFIEETGNLRTAEEFYRHKKGSPSVEFDREKTKKAISEISEIFKKNSECLN